MLHRRTLCTLYPPREMDKIGSEIGIEIDEKSLSLDKKLERDNGFHWERSERALINGRRVTLSLPPR